MSDESDYRQMQQDQADRTEHLESRRRALVTRADYITNLASTIDVYRTGVRERETELAQEKRQHALDAQALGILEAWHRNPVRAGEALSDIPYHRVTWDLVNDLRLHNLRENAAAGARLDDAQRTGTPEGLAKAWGEAVTYLAVANDLGRLMALMGRPLDLVDVDKAYPADAPAAGSLGPRSENDGD